MTSNIELSLQKVIKEFEDFSNLILLQMDILIKTLETYHEGIPDKIISQLFENEEKIDKYEVKLDDQIIKVIVLYKPVASDLRQLFAIYRMLINLERVGDLVIKIVNHINNINDVALFEKHAPTIHQMAKLSAKMVSKSLISFTNKDAGYALWTIKKDSHIDELNQKFLRESIEKEVVPAGFQQLFMGLSEIRSVISSIERIGDHATNIAEASLYALLGKNVRHQGLSENTESQ